MWRFWETIRFGKNDPKEGSGSASAEVDAEGSATETGPTETVARDDPLADPPPPGETQRQAERRIFLERLQRLSLVFVTTFTSAAVLNLLTLSIKLLELSLDSSTVETLELEMDRLTDRVTSALMQAGAVAVMVTALLGSLHAQRSVRYGLFALIGLTLVVAALLLA